VTEQKGGLLSFGILAALWSSSSAVVAITAALNQAYDVEEGRPWWKVRGIALLLTMGLSLFLLLAMVLLIFEQHLNNLRRKDSLGGAETAQISVRLGNLFRLAL
jgi:uncharacterized BrkB/YihY/UPF0761 family membrane protein